MSDVLGQLRDLVPEALFKRITEDGLLPEPLLYELRMLHRDLVPNLAGRPSDETIKRAQERTHAMIMRWGRGEFFT